MPELPPPPPGFFPVGTDTQDPPPPGFYPASQVEQAPPPPVGFRPATENPQANDMIWQQAKTAANVITKPLGAISEVLSIPSQGLMGLMKGAQSIIKGKTASEAIQDASKSIREGKTIFSEFEQAAYQDSIDRGIDPRLARAAAFAGGLFADTAITSGVPAVPGKVLGGAGKLIKGAAEAGTAAVEAEKTGIPLTLLRNVTKEGPQELSDVGKVSKDLVGFSGVEDKIPVPAFPGSHVLAKLDGFIDQTGQVLGKAFIPKFGQPQAYQDLAENALVKSTNLVREVQSQVSEAVQGLTGEQRLQVGEAIKNFGQSADPVITERAMKLRGLLDQLGEQAVQAGLLTPETYAANKGTYMARFYDMHELKPAALDMVRQFMGGLEMTRPNVQRFMKRQDIPEAIRLAMGEILDPAYAVGKGAAQTAHANVMADFYTNVARNPDWSSSLAKDGMKQLPRDYRLGALSEQYVLDPIHAELTQQLAQPGTIEKLYNKALGLWKVSKILPNPATHFRNMLSNMILSDLGGLSPLRVDIYKNAAGEMMSKGKYFQEAQTAGLFGREFAANEINDFVKPFLGNYQDATVPMAQTASLFSKAKDKLGEIYQTEEQYFKLAKFIHNRELGMTAEEAVKDAHKWLFDYSKTTPFIKGVGKTAIPFVTFTYKAIPVIAEAAAKNPFTLWKYPMLVSGLSMEAANQLKVSDSEWKQIRELLPSHIRRGEFLLLPTKDENGRLQLVDFTYIFPWGDVGEVNQRGARYFFSNPFITLAEDVLRGRQAFMDRPLYDERDQTITEKEKFVKSMEHVYRTLMPSLSPNLPFVTEHGGYSYDAVAKSIQGLPDYAGRTQSVPLALMRALMGIKVEKVDMDERAKASITDYRQNLEFLRGELIKTMKDQSIPSDQKGSMIKELQDKIQQRMTMGLFGK